MKSTAWTVCLAFALTVALPASVDADPLADFEAARAKWRAAGLKNYSFIYEWAGAVVVAPDCAGARIRAVVRNGVGWVPVVISGNRRCPAGTRGEKAIGLEVPRTIDAAFEEIEAELKRAELTRVKATYDPELGIPLRYLAESLVMTDSDGGFRISAFARH